MKSLLSRQFAIFLGVGCVATLVHYAILIGMVEGWRLKPVPATLMGYVAGALTSYALNRHFTYQTSRNHWQATWRFGLVALGGFGLTWIIMQMLTMFFKMPYLPSQIFITGLVLFWSFYINKLWTFRV